MVGLTLSACLCDAAATYSTPTKIKMGNIIEALWMTSRVNEGDDIRSPAEVEVLFLLSCCGRGFFTKVIDVACKEVIVLSSDRIVQQDIAKLSCAARNHSEVVVRSNSARLEELLRGWETGLNFNEPAD